MEEERLGFNKANRIYLTAVSLENTGVKKSFIPECKNLSLKNENNFQSGVKESFIQECKNLSPNDTNINNTDFNKSNINDTNSINHGSGCEEYEMDNNQEFDGKDGEAFEKIDENSSKLTETEELARIKDYCQLHSFTEKEVQLPLECAIETMFYSDCLKVGSAVARQPFLQEFRRNILQENWLT